ncbi:GTP-binding protein [Roseibacillus ishigakijimensis]|uniref:GTP-binding protein n=1 Tax=Roseibacillus ishigakijimensis TaxID=454146 RepID=A0A934VLN1_9BACT|nr:GTP-binding protein [Roseibacillus ishigakijimensis]MBK1834859.1 GTP-binding protein [Roseibacillus ishigakijimensis]
MDKPLSPSLPSLPPVAAVRPLLMLTGFLGAGKTTFLRALLGDLTARGHLADVILNDREDARLDQAALQDHAASVEALTGSCVCCEGTEELCDLILRASQSPRRVLLLEFNGTADPIPLLETFTLLENKFCLRPRWQVCILDARHFGRRGRFDDLEKLQLETASHYFLSRTADLSGKEELRLEKAIRAINPQASRATPATLADSLSEVIRRNRRHTVSTRHPAARQPGGNFRLSPAPAEKHVDRHRLAHEFTGCNLLLPPVLPAGRITHWLQQLPVSVIRAKALVTLDTDPDCRFLFERVGMEVSPWPLPVSGISKAPCSGLFIGPDLQPEALLQLTREHLDPDCHFAHP